MLEALWNIASMLGSISHRKMRTSANTEGYYKIFSFPNTTGGSRRNAARVPVAEVYQDVPGTDV